MLAILPHHGSDAEKVNAILEAPFDGCIVAVDPHNEYGHPGPRNMLAAVQRFGKERVYLTGKGGNVTIRGGEFPEAQLGYAATLVEFVLPQRRRLELSLRRKEDALFTAIHEKNRSKFRNIWNAIVGVTASMEATYQLEDIYLDRPLRESEIPYEVPNRYLAQSITQGSTDAWREYINSVAARMLHRHGRTSVGWRALYEECESYLPLAGGVVVGGVVKKEDVVPVSAQWVVTSTDEPGPGSELKLVVACEGIGDREYKATYTEFYLAQQLAAANEITLVSGAYEANGRHYFIVNPVIANTLVAWYALQLDSFLETSGRFTVAKNLTFEMPEWRKLVWIDVPSVIGVSGANLEVRSAMDGSHMLYQVLIKNWDDPVWWQEYQKDPVAYLGRDYPRVASLNRRVSSLKDEARELRREYEQAESRKKPSSGMRIGPSNESHLPGLRELQEESLKKLRDRHRDRIPETPVLSASQLRTMHNAKVKECNAEIQRLNEVVLELHNSMLSRYQTYTWDNAYTQAAQSSELNQQLDLVARELPALGRLNAFAQTVHVLRWLEGHKIQLPSLSRANVVSVNVPENLDRDEYLPSEILALRGRVGSNRDGIEALTRDFREEWDFSAAGILSVAVLAGLAVAIWVWRRRSGATVRAA